MTAGGGLRRLCAALFIASIAVPAAQAEPVTQTVAEHRNDIGEIEKRARDFLHRASGFVYPMQLGEMPARKTHSYGPGDADVYYTLFGGAKGDPWITLFVYPASGDLAQEAEVVSEPIIQNYGGTLVAKPAGLAAGPAGAVDRWYSGKIGEIPVTTGFRLLRSGSWSIKARVSVPVSGGEASMRRAMDGLNAIPWGWQPRPATAASGTKAALQRNAR